MVFLDLVYFKHLLTHSMRLYEVKKEKHGEMLVKSFLRTQSYILGFQQHKTSGGDVWKN